MHKYMSAIGFHDLNKKEVRRILQGVAVNPDRVTHALDTEGNEFAEIRKEVTSGVGIALRGYYDDNDEFHMDYYYPYSEGLTISTNASVEMVKESDKESFLGLCDEIKLGVDLIFFIQDMFEILSSEQRNRKMIDFGEVRLSGLCSEGMILFPLKRTEYQLEKARKSGKYRKDLIVAARDGDEDAIEELALIDMDLYTNISNRVQNEDILSIVNTYFMPNGVECDKYSVMGEIRDMKKLINRYTMENIYVMTIESNEMVYEITIAENDLMGEPQIGRRFKGKLWMQGRVTPL